MSAKAIDKWEEPDLAPHERAEALYREGKLRSFHEITDVRRAIEAAIQDVDREYQVRACECGADEACGYLRERDKARLILNRTLEYLQDFVQSATAILRAAENKGGQQVPPISNPMFPWVRSPTGIRELRRWRDIFAALLETDK